MSDLSEDVPDPTDLPIFSSPRPAQRRGPGAHALAGRISPFHTDTARPAESRAVPEEEFNEHPGAGPALYLGLRPRPVVARRSAGIDVDQVPVPPASTNPNGIGPLPADLGRWGGAEIVADWQINWQEVALLRAQASDQLSAAVGEDRTMDPDAEREFGRSIIQELIQTTAADRLHDGKQPWSLPEQDALAEAVFHALFGLGRLQPLVDDDTVENVIIIGADNVWLEKTDGTLVRTAPVADSDQELLDFLAFVASRSEASARSFSSVNPRLHMRLDGGARLAAAAWVTAQPSIVIRRHRLVRVTLADLVGRGMLTSTQATFLRAAVLARKSIVVAGAQGAGKTTLVRALCSEIPPHEAIGTFETEFELHLHELRDIHPIVHAWEARPGSGEIGADGRPAGEFTIDEALYDSFRFNLSRQIVGEVRGPEIWAMIKAMESGAGSISTTHAADAEAAIRKLVTCAMEAGPHVTKELATSKLAETVDIIVQVNLQTVPGAGERQQWHRSRWVSEIIHVTPGEAVKGYATTHVFRPNPAGGPGLPGTLPDELRSLEWFGFDLPAYLADHGRAGDGRAEGPR
jgi:pilus assembly protein CpaF